MIETDASSNSAITGGTLTFGIATPGEAIIDVQYNASTTTAGDQNNLTISSAINATSLTKDGDNALILTGTNNFSGTTYLNRGRLLVTQNNQLGSGVVIGNGGQQTAYTQNYQASGSLSLDANGLNYNIPLTIGGATSNQAGSFVGSLDSQANFTNTWSGNITFDWSRNRLWQPALEHHWRRRRRQPGSQRCDFFAIHDHRHHRYRPRHQRPRHDCAGRQLAQYLRWGNPHIEGGTLIIEKDQALGTTFSNTSETDNIVMDHVGNSTFALPAPGTSPGFSMTTNKWLFLNARFPIRGRQQQRRASRIWAARQ